MKRSKTEPTTPATPAPTLTGLNPCLKQQNETDTEVQAGQRLRPRSWWRGAGAVWRAGGGLLHAATPVCHAGAVTLV